MREHAVSLWSGLLFRCRRLRFRTCVFVQLLEFQTHYAACCKEWEWKCEVRAFLGLSRGGCHSTHPLHQGVKRQESDAQPAYTVDVNPWSCVRMSWDGHVSWAGQRGLDANKCPCSLRTSYASRRTCVLWIQGSDQNIIVGPNGWRTMAEDPRTRIVYVMWSLWEPVSRPVV